MSTRPITDTLRHIGGGVFIDTASDKLAELVAAVDQSGKAGRIDLSISVKKATRGGAMHITGKVKLTKLSRCGSTKAYRLAEVTWPGQSVKVRLDCP